MSYPKLAPCSIGLRLLPRILHIRSAASVALVATLSMFFSLASADPNIPFLEWTERSDWINVTTDLMTNAIPNDELDDTAALQEALDKFNDKIVDEGVNQPKVVYLPYGTYRITETLEWPSSDGCSLIGHGSGTTIIWDGPDDPSGSVMLWTRGAAHSRIDGITWDANNTNTIAVNHRADTRLESSVSHYNSAFLNASVGIEGDSATRATSEMFIENCLFENCGTGIDMSKKANYYNQVVVRCEFRDNDYGVQFGAGYGYVRFCHFENTTNFDIQGAIRTTARYCTSLNSGAFYDSTEAGGRAGVIQNCVVSSWNNDYAVRVSDNSLLFDNVFENPPLGESVAPIYFFQDDAIVSENVSAGTTELYDFESPWADQQLIAKVPSGNRARVPLNATDSFLITVREVPTKIFDAVAYGAVPNVDAEDDTDAVQATIDAARNHGNGAIAYFPAGQYLLSDTIDVSGADYVIGGSGYYTEFRWDPAVSWDPLNDPRNVMFAIDTPRNIHVEHLTFPVGGLQDGCIAIQQTGSGESSITYNGLFLPQQTVTTNDLARFREGLHIKDLDPQGTVYFGRVNGRILIEDSAQGTIVGEFLNGNHTKINGADHPQTGFTGWGSMNGHELVVDDNQSLVVADLNFEQSNVSGVEGIRNIKLRKGAATNTVGQVTVGSIKANLYDSTQNFEINDYEGQFSYLHGTPYPDKTAPNAPGETRRDFVELIHDGTSPIDVFIGATRTHLTQMPILVNADSGLTLTTLENSHWLPLPNEWYGDSDDVNSWVTSSVALEDPDDLEPNEVDFARKFDGVDDFLLGSAEPKLGWTNDELTAMAWVKPSVLGQDAHLMGYLRVIDSTDHFAWYLRLNNDDTLEFVVKDKNPPMGVDPVYSSGKSRPLTPADLSTWVHVAGVWDGTTVKLYINGSIMEGSSGPAVFNNLHYHNDHRFVVGGSHGQNKLDRFYAGALDEVRVYDKVLSAGTIYDHFNDFDKNTQTGSFGAWNEADLVAGWHFNEGVNINSFDYSDDDGGLHLLHYEIDYDHNPMDDPMDPNDYGALDIASNALDHFRELGEHLQDFSVGLPVHPIAAPAIAVSDTQVDLKWYDRSSNETSFDIESKTGVNGTWSKIGSVAVTEPDTSNAGPDHAITASDTNLTPETEYFYRIRAVNSAGESFPSNEVSAITASPIPPPQITWWKMPMWAHGDWDHTTLHWIPASGIPDFVTFNDGDVVHFDENEIEVNLVGILRPSKIISTGYGNNKWFLTGSGVISDSATPWHPRTTMEIANGYRKVNALGDVLLGHTFSGGVLIHSGGELELFAYNYWGFGKGPITLDDGALSVVSNSTFRNEIIIESGGGSLNTGTNGFYYYWGGWMQMYGDLTLGTAQWDRVIIQSGLSLNDDVTIIGGNTHNSSMFETKLSGPALGPHVLTINVTGLGMAIERSVMPWDINGLTKTGPGILRIDAFGACGNTLRIDSGSVELLVDQTVSGLYLGGAPQAAGTYGSSSSSAANQNDTYFSGSGIVTVQ